MHDNEFIVAPRRGVHKPPDAPKKKKKERSEKKKKSRERLTAPADGVQQVIQREPRLVQTPVRPQRPDPHGRPRLRIGDIGGKVGLGRIDEHVERCHSTGKPDHLEAVRRGGAHVVARPAGPQEPIQVACLVQKGHGVLRRHRDGNRAIARDSEGCPWDLFASRLYFWIA